MFFTADNPLFQRSGVLARLDLNWRRKQPRDAARHNILRDRAQICRWTVALPRFTSKTPARDLETTFGTCWKFRTFGKYLKHSIYSFAFHQIMLNSFELHWILRSSHQVLLATTLAHIYLLSFIWFFFYESSFHVAKISTYALWG